MLRSEKPLKPPLSRMIALQIVLTLTIFSNIFGAGNAVRNFDVFLSTYPKLNNVLAYVYISCALLAVIGAYYLWSLKKFGFYFICTALIAVIGLDIYAGIAVQHMLIAMGLFALIIIVLIPVRNYLK